MILALMVSILSISISCETKEVPEISQERLREIFLIGSTWRLERVTVDGMNETDTYRDLTISFSQSSYSTSNGRVIWPETGTWEFVDDSNTVIRRGDGLLVTIQSITSNSLVLALVWESRSIDTGRKLAIAGNHIFEFGK